jgi:hypothetical protein
MYVSFVDIINHLVMHDATTATWSPSSLSSISLTSLPTISCHAYTIHYPWHLLTDSFPTTAIIATATASPCDYFHGPDAASRSTMMEAMDGDARVINNMAYVLQHGLFGNVVDHRAAVDLYRRAAWGKDAGHHDADAYAAFNLGVTMILITRIH